MVTTVEPHKSQNYELFSYTNTKSSLSIITYKYKINDMKILPPTLESIEA